MKNKTAMMEAFNHLEDWLSSGKDVYQWIYLYKDIYIEKEKEQIMECYIDGWEGWWTCTDEEFYKQKYKQD